MMRAKQALQLCVMLLVACPLTAAIAQPQRCDTLPAIQRDYARAIGACRDLAPIIDIAPPVETTPSAAPPVPSGTEAIPTPASPGNTQVKKLTPQRTEARKSTSKPAAASAQSAAPSKTAASRKSESERRNEPLDSRGWQTYQDDRYTFRYPADLVTASHRNGGVELHSLDREFHIRASARINSKKDTVQSAWQQRLKEHGRSVTYKKKGDAWFVVSGVEGGKTYYRKQFVSPERMAELVITYPKSRASVYDSWVTEIEKSFVAYRVSDTAQPSSDTEPSSVVAKVPAVNESAAAAVPASSAAPVASALQLEPSTAPVQNDRAAGGSIGRIASNVVAALIGGVLLGLLLGAVLMRRALRARSRALDTAPAEHMDIAPASIDSQAATEVDRLAAIEPPPEAKFTAWLEPHETTIKFADRPQNEAVTIEYSTDQYAEQHQAAFTVRNFER
jgi:hypothetical protein